MQQLQQSPRPALPRYIVECTVEFLTVEQQGEARAVSRLMQSVVSVVSMEHLMKATAVCGNEEGLLPVADSGRATLVVIASGRVVKPFPSVESLLSWCGGHVELFTQVRQRFPSTAIGISTRLLGTRPFPSASDGHSATTTCVVFPARGSNARTIESVTLSGPPDTKVLALCLCPSMLCLEAIASGRPLATSLVPLSSIKPAVKLEWSAFALVSPLALVLVNLSCEVTPIGYQPSSSFSNSKSFISVDLSGLPTLVSMNGFFARCSSLLSVSLCDMQCVETISDDTFAGCKRLTDVNLSDMPNLRTFGNAFCECESLISIVLRNLPSLTSFSAPGFYSKTGFNACMQLSSVSLCGLPSLAAIGDNFRSCTSITSISLQNMQNLEFGNSVIDPFPFNTTSLTTIIFKNLQRVRHINKDAFGGLQGGRGFGVRTGAKWLTSVQGPQKNIAHVELSDLLTLREIGKGAFSACTSLLSFPFEQIPSFESIGDDAFAGCKKLGDTDLAKHSKKLVHVLSKGANRSRA